MKVSGYEVTEAGEGLILQKAKPSYFLIVVVMALVAVMLWLPFWNGKKSSQEALWDAFSYVVIVTIVLLPSRPWLRKKSVRVHPEERAIYLDDQKVPFEEIRTITTERAWWFHDVMIYTQDKSLVVFPWVSQQDGNRLCEIICKHLPVKESHGLLPWGVSFSADSQLQTPNE